MGPDDPVDQFRLPWVAVIGEPTERILDAAEFDAWAALRSAKCGHRELSRTCRWCVGTLDACDAMSMGSTKIRLFPAQL